MTAPRQRKRKPPMPDVHRAAADAAVKRMDRRPINPGVEVETRQGERGPVRTFGPSHRDLSAWEAQICDAFGTRSESTYVVFLGQLAALCGGRWNPETGADEPDPSELNAAVNFVNSIRPRNVVEAALAAQMFAVHLMTMRLGAQVMGNGGWIDPRNGAMVGKLARTYAMQCDALAKLRGKTGKQHIKVSYERHEHKHVHIKEGGAGNGTRAQAPAHDAIESRAAEPVAPLPSPDKARDALPGAGCYGQVALPNARRR